MYQTGDTIKDTIDAIQLNQYVLPAIQREFVWKPEQIAKLFDSIMQGYPFGTFLFWEVAPERSKDYKFYGFVRDYHERDRPHCPELPVFNEKPLTAVLDGQQRLTALNIGLCGSMAIKLPHKWKNNPDAYPSRHLYLDLLADRGEDEEGGERYRLAFLTSERANSADPDECWFKVSDILTMSGGPPMLEWLNERLPQEHLNRAFTTLDQLYRVVHTQHLIAFYEEKSQDLEKVLNIFIRMNSGGTVLSYSDLLLSIAVAQWSSLDARAEIHNLVDELNRVGAGFDISKDFVLKAGLMLADIGNVGFKVENFNHTNMVKLEKSWPQIRDALILCVQLVASFGFDGQTLRADSALLPIAYYLHKWKRGGSYLTSTKYGDDREVIRQWLVRSFLKASGIWGSGLDTLLTLLREAIEQHGEGGFPINRIHDVMDRRGKSLGFTDEEITELVEMEYGDRRVFSMLSLLFPFVDLKNQFHVDHVFPRAGFAPRKLRKAGVPEEEIEDHRGRMNGLANLQLLGGPENQAKKSKLPAAWLKEQFDDARRLSYCENHLLGEVPDSVLHFGEFYETRREALRKRVTEVVRPT